MREKKTNINAEIQRILSATVKARKINHDELAPVLGMDRTNVGRILNGRRPIRDSEIDKLAEYLGLKTRDLIAKALGEENFVAYQQLGDDVDNFQDDNLQSNFDVDQGSDAISGVGNYRPRLGGAIPEIDVNVGAGEGAVGEIVAIRLGDESYSGHPVLGEWVMPANYLLHELHLVNKDTVMLRVVGDSMYPTYRHNDRVLVDQRQNEVKVDGVYVISDGDSPPQIKRIEIVYATNPREVNIISDNTSHTTQRVRLSMLQVIGRVAGKVSAE